VILIQRINKVEAIHKVGLKPRNKA